MESRGTHKLRPARRFWEWRSGGGPNDTPTRPRQVISLPPSLSPPTAHRHHASPPSPPGIGGDGGGDGGGGGGGGGVGVGGDGGGVGGVMVTVVVAVLAVWLVVW